MSEQVTEPADPARSDAFIEVNDLKTYYGAGGMFGGNPVKAVDGVDFDIQRGETFGLVGESGCGKTTLGRTLVRLETPTDGEVYFDGQDIAELSGSELKEWRRNAQIVFQDPESSLNDRMTVGEIIREPLDVHDWKTKRERRERVRDLLVTVGLSEEHYFRYPHQFSGGQRQRVGIARALALDPEFVVLDEPVSALDVSVQAKILNLLEDLQSEMNLTYLLIAHDLSVVRHICDRVGVMYLGNIMELGPTEELFADPGNPYTRALLSAIPEPDPTVEADRTTLRGTPPSPRNPPEGCPFSTRCPEKIHPDEYDLDPDVWERIEIFREVVRERDRANPGVVERARDRLGLDTRFVEIAELRDEVFDGVSLPADVERQVDEATSRIEDGREHEARELLHEEFGSECDHVYPETYEISDDGRESRCHLHDADVEEPAVAGDSLVER